MKSESIKSIKEFLGNLQTEININAYVSAEDIDIYNPFESIEEQLNDSGGFNIEIIYYQTAIEYLMKNDNSLRQSLELASDFGFNPKNLNSEILASLLASEIERENFNDLKSEIEVFFEGFIIPNEENKE